MRRRVVITGLGVLTPLGNTVQEMWSALLAGKSGAGPITRFDASSLPVQFACEIKGFQPEDWLDRREIRRTDPFIWYATCSADQAMQDAGYDKNTILKDSRLRDRFGVVWASGIGGILTFMEEVSQWGRNPKHRFNPMFIPKVIVDSGAGFLSIRYGLRGPNYATVSACASSLHAVIEGTLLIRQGFADVMLVGGSEAPICYVGIAGFAAMKALSQRNDSPETASRPYDKDRDGFVMGEGAGALILEELEHARARGAKIYAEIVGVGMNADAYHITAPHPEGETTAQVMQLALNDAQLPPTAIDYINTHGTSTPLGDISELKAILKAFGEHAYNLNISAPKSMLGHLLGAAGAVESIICVLALRDQIVPPTINHFTDDPEIDPKLNLTFWKAQKRTIHYALNNSFGFGGHNASVIFKRWDESP